MSMAGRSKTPPKGDVRPLGTPREKLGSRQKSLGGKVTSVKKVRAIMQNVLDTGPAAEVKSSLAIPAAKETPIMTLTLKSHSKNGKQAYYSGAANVLRFTLTSFVNGRAPQTIPLPDGVFAEPKAKQSAEERQAAAAERKAQRANQPKPTLAEKVAAAEKRLEAQRAKLAAEQAGHASM